MKNLISSFKNTALPVIQTKLINGYDGSIQSILEFEQLHLILNPSFSHHYLYVSGTSEENTITTKHTDGSSAAWGSQTPEMENNSYIFARELKKELMKLNTCNCLGNPLTPCLLNEKIHVKIGMEIIKIKGLTNKSISNFK